MTALADKVLVLGIDGLDPRLTSRYMEEGIMPNFKKFCERGSHSVDLNMIGGQPTVTPPMWTTLATGASPAVHGITDYHAQAGENGEDLGGAVYNFDSRRCKAEPMWNVTANAGLKTLVWHWPGSSWPPTSDNPNLTVVDGTQPGGVNIGNAQVDAEQLVFGSVKNKEVTYKFRAANDIKVPCFIEGMEIEEGSDVNGIDILKIPEIRTVAIKKEELMNDLSSIALDAVFTPIRDANGWSIDVPEGAKECFLTYSKGLIRRAMLLTKNANGIYDTLVVYKNKKSTEPIAILPFDVFVENIVDEAIVHDKSIPVSRSMRLLEVAEDGTAFKLWMSPAMDFNNSDVWYPRELLGEIVEHVGYPVPIGSAGSGDVRLLTDCTHQSWEQAANWTANCLKYLIRNKEYKVIYSHFHNVDLQGHLLVQYLRKGLRDVTPEQMQLMFKHVYEQTDRYLGNYLELLDEGWTILIVSDHGQVCPEHEVADMINAGNAVNGYLMSQFGYTVFKKDENGNDLHEVDWSKTTAVATRINHIYVNLKGRNPYGIVEEKDKFELEERIITDLYGLRDPETGHRTIHLALRNRDAVLLGMGGPASGDIIYWIAEGYNWDHADSISTIDGACGTSVRSVFIGAGKGIKENYITERVVHHVDITPTVAALIGCDMPAQAEGAPIYQILQK